MYVNFAVIIKKNEYSEDDIFHVMIFFKKHSPISLIFMSFQEKYMSDACLSIWVIESYERMTSLTNIWEPAKKECLGDVFSY